MENKFQDKYPEHVKLNAVSKDSQKIGEFLDWLSEHGIELCRWEHYNGNPKNDKVLYPVHRSINNILAEYFDIDEKKIDTEKRLMLEELRNV